jgi:ribosome maturation factor RimP
MGKIYDRGPKVPCFIGLRQMIDKNKIQKVVETTDLGKEFVIVDIEAKPKNNFTVFLESLEGITISDCVKVSRHIEQHFNRDDEDYDMNVSSAGLDKPLKAPIQFVKNIGKTAEVVTNDDKKLKGVLMNYNKSSISLSYFEKEKMEGSKKMHLVEKNIEIELNKIKTVTIVVSFK